MKKDEFHKSYFLIVFSLVMYSILYLVLTTLFSDRIFDISVTMLAAIPSLILIIVTVMYVSITLKILKENQLFRKRTFIEGMVKKILFPLLDSIKNVMERFQTKSCYFVKNQECNLEKIQLKNLGFDKFHKYADVWFCVTW